MTAIRDKLFFSAVMHMLFIVVFLLNSTGQHEKGLFLTVSLVDEKDREADGQTMRTPLLLREKKKDTVIPFRKPTTAVEQSSVKESREVKHYGIPSLTEEPGHRNEVSLRGYAEKTAAESGRTGKDEVSSEVISIGGKSSKGQGTDAVSLKHSSASPVDKGALFQGIRQAIEKTLVYPPLARMRRMEGTVVVEFSINGQGMPENLRLIKTSGFNILDSAAEKTIIKASPFPVVAGSIEIPITFRLEKGR